MKNRIIFVIMLIALVNNNANAIELKYGAKAGVNFTNTVSGIAVEIPSDTEYEEFLKPGFHIGAIAEVMFNKYLSLEFNLLFQNKGKKEIWTYESSDKSTLSYTEESTIYSIDIPIMAKAGFLIGPVKTYILFGGYTGIGMFGKYRDDIESRDERFSIEWGQSYKRFDAGLIYGCGIQILKVFISASADQGLVKSIKLEKNAILRISVGYMF